MFAIVIQYILVIAPLCLHCIGWYLLHSRSANVSASQRIFLLNLSMSEIFLCLLYIGGMTVRYIFGPGTTGSLVLFLCLYSFVATYVLIMICLTLDRLIAVYLNLKYSLYWSTEKTKVLVSIFWMISLLLSCAIIIYFFQDRRNYTIIMHMYTYLSLAGDGVFVIVAMVTYSYIIKKLWINNQVYASSKPHRNLSSQSDVTNTCRVLWDKQKHHIRQRKLLLPTLLVVTFIVFIVIPDVVYFCIDMHLIPDNYETRRIFDSMFYIGLTSDAIIYVMLATTVGRTFLKRKLLRRTTP